MNRISAAVEQNTLYIRVADKVDSHRNTFSSNNNRFEKSLQIRFSAFGVFIVIVRFVVCHSVYGTHISGAQCVLVKMHASGIVLLLCVDVSDSVDLRKLAIIKNRSV